MKTIISMTVKMAALFALGWMTGCQTNTTPNNNVTDQSANKTATNAAQPEAKTAINTNQPETVDADTTKSSAGSLALPTEAYKAAYAARQKKDVQGLKRVLSKDMLEFFTIIGQSEQKSLDDALLKLAEKPQAPTDETRNEKINGDKATLEYLDEQGKWKTMDFVKEGDNWKLTFPDAQSPVVTDTTRKNK